MKQPYQITMFVSPMGHDVNYVSSLLARWLEQTRMYQVTVVGECPHAVDTIENFMGDAGRIKATDLFFFLCADEHWKDESIRKNLEKAVAGGTPILFFHGLHPCFRDWAEIEKMIGLLWRDEASHGDFNYCDVKMTETEHPITEGITGFRTKDELFCGLSNVWNVEFEVLATAYSDPELESRWSAKGTGNNEPVLTVGNYGKGRTVDFILGHKWMYYTGHGLLENSTIAFEPPQFKTLLLRSCEWAITGDVKRKEL